MSKHWIAARPLSGIRWPPHADGMTRVEFIKIRRPEKALHLCRLAEEFFEAGHKIVVTVGDENQGITLDRFMWVWKKSAFVPHAYDNGAVDCLDEPVLILHDERNPNGADVLIMGRPCSPHFVGQFSLVIDFAEIYDDELATQARQRYIRFREAGFAVAMRQ